MLGRGISFSGTVYIINTIELECTNVLGTIVLGRVINLGDTTDMIIHVTLQCKN
jgi:hypothetical protein